MISGATNTTIYFFEVSFFFWYPVDRQKDFLNLFHYYYYCELKFGEGILYWKRESLFFGGTWGGGTWDLHATSGRENMNDLSCLKYINFDWYQMPCMLIPSWKWMVRWGVWMHNIFVQSYLFPRRTPILFPPPRTKYTQVWSESRHQSWRNLIDRCELGEPVWNMNCWLQ